MRIYTCKTTALTFIRSRTTFMFGEPVSCGAPGAEDVTPTYCTQPVMVSPSRHRPGIAPKLCMCVRVAEP